MANDAHSAAHALGRRRAGLFQGFACFVHEQATRLGLQQLFFITREGVFFKTVFDAHLDGSGITGTQIETRLIEASRRSTFGPSLAVAAHTDFQRLWNLYPRISPLAFIKSLNLDQDEFAAFFEERKLPLEFAVEQPWNHAEFAGVLHDETFRRLLRANLQAQLESARCYFDPLFAGLDRIGIVEIGWQGSIQDNLATIYPQKEFHGFYLGLSRFKNPPLANSHKAAFGPDRNRSDRHPELLDAVNVMEFLSLTSGGSVTSYRQLEPGKSIAIRNIDPAEEDFIKGFSEPFQRGVIEECSPDLARTQYGLLASGTLRNQALEHWHRILTEPDQELVRCYFSLKSNEEFGLGEFRDQSRTPSWETIVRAPFSQNERSQLISYLTFSQWADGMRRRRDISTMKRWALYVLMRIALRIKPFIQARRIRRQAF